ncbi:hypothetical protein SDC9_190700 [bioreactor metagenome]|uniref:Uncharacterized protein n=1 Tax=bioreactor metagenome TaxID=1076179 RepID=A0A645HVQ6_9ZZZZ
MVEQHAYTIQVIVLGSKSERLPDTVPVKRGIEDSLGKITVGQKVGPLPLPLETSRYGVVSKRFFTVSHDIQRRIPYHQVAHD